MAAYDTITGIHQSIHTTPTVWTIIPVSSTHRPGKITGTARQNIFVLLSHQTSWLITQHRVHVFLARRRTPH